MGILIRKLEQFGPLSDDERHAIESTSFFARNVKADQDIARVGERLLHCPLLLDGFACRYRLEPTPLSPGAISG